MKNKALVLLAVVFFLISFGAGSLWAQAKAPNSGAKSTQGDKPQDAAQSEALSAPQSAPQGGGRYVIEQRYVQQISWKGDEYTRKYEVVIERIEGKTNSVVLREFTEKATLEISLPPGNYRYRIIPYDYLNQTGEPSKWVTLEIKPAPVAQDIPETAGTQADKGGSFDFFASAAWSPIIPLYGEVQKVFGNAFYGGGASVRLGAFYNKTNWWIIPGAELSASFYALNKSEVGNEITMQAGTTGINFVAQKQLPHRMAINARVGFALGFQTGDVNAAQYNYKTGGVIPQFSLEASFLWVAWKQLFLEGGLGYIVFLNINDGSGCLRPWIGAGWKF